MSEQQLQPQPTEAPVAAAPVAPVEPVATNEAEQSEGKTIEAMSEGEIKKELTQQRELRKKLENVVRSEKVSTLEGAGITTEVINAWKGEHGPVEALTINGQIYVYRGLRRIELKKMQEETANADNTLREDIIAEKCTLYPQLNRGEFSNFSAGVPTTLAERIMALSGFEIEEEVPVRL